MSTSYILRGILSKEFFIVSFIFGSLNNTSFMFYLSSVSVLFWRSYTLNLSILQQFSIGFRSEELPGQCNTLILKESRQFILTLDLWQEASSCIEVYLFFLYLNMSTLFPRRNKLVQDFRPLCRFKSVHWANVWVLFLILTSTIFLFTVKPILIVKYNLQK